ncbi:hypothetical protein CR513_11677, partial [Mucuna pruriens]
MEFKWEESQERAFKALKDRLNHALILALPKFSKSFMLEYDASNVGIGQKKGKVNIVANALSRIHVLSLLELCANLAQGGFSRLEGFLFKDRRLCMPRSSFMELLVKEAHEIGLKGHFGKVKIYETLVEHFIGFTCGEMYIMYVKGVWFVGEKSPRYLLPMGCLDVRVAKISSMIVNRFSKMAHFIPYRKENNACHMANPSLG